jgi:hypothetical protein
MVYVFDLYCRSIMLWEGTRLAVQENRFIYF